MLLEPTPMKQRLLLAALLLLSPVAALRAQAPSAHGANAEKAAAPKLHPLKGVVVDVFADKQSLLVKHEEVPGVMHAMTMAFHVEPAVLAQVKKGDAITALMGRDENKKWILRDVKVVPKS